MTRTTMSPSSWTRQAVSAIALMAGLGSAAHAQTAPADRLPPTPAQAAQPSTPGDAAGDIVVTGRFINTGASSATKMDIRVLDTPASVDSYNGNFLKAIETTNVSDLYRYMTGIQRAGNTGYDITFRGFKTSGNDRGAILTDGLPGLSVRFGSPPTIGVDHIELVKGPTSVLYGQGQPGGFINIITKKPKFRPHFELDVKGLAGAGEFNRELGGLVAVDLTGPISGSLAGRIVAEGGETSGFRDYSDEKPIYVAPSIAWRIGSKTTITLGAEYRRVRSHYDTYLVAPNRDVRLIAPINTSYQEPKDYLIERGTIGNIYVAHQFSDKIKLNVGYRYVDHEDRQSNYDVVGFRNATTITRRARGQENKRTYSFGDANVTAKLNTFGVGHTLLIGANGGRETASLNRTQFYNGTVADGLDLNIYHPVLGVVPAPSSFPLFNAGKSANLNWRYTTQKSLGFYGSDLLSFGEMFKALVGLRYADERQTIEDKRILTFVPEFKKDTKWLPQAGLLFEPTRFLTFYTSYSTSFVPVAASSQDNFGNNPFKPTTAKSIEGGVKANLFHGRLNVTSAYFDIKKKNTLNTFKCLTSGQLIAAGVVLPPGTVIASGTCSNQLGGERSRGFELEVNATPLLGWQITGGYAHTHARVTSSNIAPQNGARLTNSPDDAFNFWSRYDFQGGRLANLGVGVGVSYIGKRAGLLPTVVTPAGAPEGGTLPLPAYTTVDAGLYYEVSDHLNLTLKVTNLFDKRYIESAGFTGDIQLVPGIPRLLTLSARMDF